MVDVETIINHFGISFSLPMEQVCSDAIDFLLTSDEDTKELDYNDMVRLPIISGLIRANFDEFFLDEAQDNTPISNELLKQVRKQGCSVTCCGDDFQAIMGFCGADSNSLNNIITAIEPEIMPLTVNFRCGKNIIAEAQRFVPDIKAWDSSPDGVVSYSKTDDFMKKFSNGDCALSRFNRVIIPICFRLIREGKKATIQGRDFGSMLKALVAGFKATSIDGFYEAIDKWKDRQLEKSKSLSVSDAIEDKFECLKHFADNSDTVEQIATTIDNIFSDKETEGLKLSTAHRSKGLEWNNVFILDSNNFMQTRPTDQAWNVQQLRNLFYVAITRSKKELTYVNA
jgi:DNA helicase-2/ATP-dependent DNA helicase PcrA